ncbi:hypothetical protein [Sinorhizobium chiapasense]|uniref:Uncharacterized protein n=1 Tax=Sinorhizobium chiapasense TaxID=501572 RepID=A0ABZ2B3M9_9HYPH
MPVPKYAGHVMFAQARAKGKKYVNDDTRNNRETTGKPTPPPSIGSSYRHRAAQVADRCLLMPKSKPRTVNDLQAVFWPV